MKHTSLFFCLFILFQSSFAQSRFSGDWQGMLNVGQELKIIFHITGDSDETLKASMDVPAQGALGLEAASVTVSEDNIDIVFSAINVNYKGTLSDSKNINGTWLQNGMSLPLKLEKSDEALTLNRPQEPKAPFSYNSEDVIYHNSDRSIQFGATITTPKDNKQHPALILITGSGPENRDEEIFGHKPFAVIADYLTKNGYVVLRVDDRGVGETTGDAKGTSADFANDVLAGINYLKSRKEVDKKKIGLLGHSEGGMIAPMVANMSKDVDFIILLAGPGVNLIDGMTAQNIEVFKSMGLPDTWSTAYGELYRNILTDMAGADSRADASAKMNTTITNWRDKTDATIITNTTAITDDASQQKFVDQFLKIYDDPWQKYFFSYDPQPALQKLNAKVLAINGEKDIQVTSELNLTGIRAALEKSNAPVKTVKEIKGVNHLFQECDKCTVQEYAQIEQTIKPEVLELITAWLDEFVK